jgi:hypothetical protein
MTQFTQDDFDMDSGEVRYVTYGPTRRFVGRFKYSRPGENSRDFVKFLIANFTVEEYFDLTEKQRMAPAEALRTKGYVSVNERSARASQARYEADQRPLTLISL